MATVSLREFGRMIDVSGEAVRKAIASGRLVASVQRDERGRPSLDPDVALVEWKKHTNTGRGSASRGDGAKLPAQAAGPKTAARPIPKPDVSEPAAPAPRARDPFPVGVPDLGPEIWAGYERRMAAAKDPDFARREKARERDDDEPDDDQAPDLNKSRAWKEHHQAELARLAVEEKQGVLIDAAEAQARWEALVQSCKTKLLSIPSKARSRLPKLDNADVALLDRLVREALEDLTQ